MKKTLALLIAIVLCVGGTSAQERYPQRPLRIVVPFAPGGSTDIIARLLGEQLSRSLGQPVVIENRPGAAGNIGAEAVARSAPDGYTLLMATTGVMAINNALYKNMSYDASTDFEYVVFVASITNVLIVAADSPLQSVGDLIAAAKRAPGHLSFASSGAGASTHMSAELFKIMAGVDLLHVPYKGSGPALPDVIVREHAWCNASHSRGYGTSACRHRPSAVERATGGPDHRRVGRAGLRVTFVERHRGTGRDAARRDRASESRDQRNHRRAPNAAEVG